MIIDCIADLHGHYPELQGGDLLIIAGDLTKRDTSEEYIVFMLWLVDQKYKRKIVIAGNHDNFLQKNPIVYEGIPSNIVSYLCDSGTEFEYEELSKKEWGSKKGPLSHIPYEKKKLKIWGSPWTKTFDGMNPNCKAFTFDTEEELLQKFCQIPIDTDIIITHSPPIYFLDNVDTGLYGENRSVGSFSLGGVLKRIKPRLHVFGHIHESYGAAEGEWQENGETTIFVNASHVNEHYEPVNKPIRVIL